jgi:hypothetical protein
MAKVDVVAFKDSSGKARVYPPVAWMKKTEDIQVTNLTGEGIVVTMPGGVFDTGGANPNPNKDHEVVAHKGKTAKANKVHANAQAGASAYKIFLLDSQVFAQGNSDPEIIIEN